MNLHSRSRSQGGVILPVIVAVILLSVGALIWEWHSSHTKAEKGVKPVKTAGHHHHKHGGKGGGGGSGGGSGGGGGKKKAKAEQ